MAAGRVGTLIAPSQPKDKRRDKMLRSPSLWSSTVTARRLRLAIALFAAALGVGLMQITGATRAYAFSASFSWCSGSPNFQLADVPEGTVTLQFAMTDLDKPSFRHGGGTIGYRGQNEVPCGAFATGFVGPAPPPGEVHIYEFVIKALAQDGTVLATTTARKKFPE